MRGLLCSPLIQNGAVIVMLFGTEKKVYWLADEVEEWNFKEISENVDFYINEFGKLVAVFENMGVSPSRFPLRW